MVTGEKTIVTLCDDVPQQQQARQPRTLHPQAIPDPHPAQHDHPWTPTASDQTQNQQAQNQTTLNQWVPD